VVASSEFTGPQDPFGDPVYKAAVIDLLGAVAYGEVSAVERLTDDAKMAPSLEDKTALLAMAAAQHAKIQPVLDRLVELGTDPYAAMEPLREGFDEFHIHTKPADWWESLVKAYVGDGLANDFYREVAGFLDEDTHKLVVTTLEDAGRADFIVDRVRAGIEAEEMKKAPAKHTVITDRIFTFVNQVAAEVEKTHPGKYVVSMAYSRYAAPPRAVRLLPNVVPQFCLWSCYRHANAAMKEEQHATAAAWARAARRAAIYEYYINGSWPGFHRLVVPQIADSIRYLHGQSIELYQTQSGDDFAINGINYYVLGRLLWDPSLDWQAIQGDYLEKGFGQAAPAMTRYFEGFENRWREARSKGLMLDDSSLKTLEGLVAVYPAAFRAERRRDIEAALKMVAGKERQRVQFVERGLAYVDATLNAVEKTIPLVKAGWQFFPEVVPPANADREALTAAIEAWEERERFITANKGTLVISYRWVQYNDHLRTFNPLWKMREWAKRGGLPPSGS